MSSTICFKCGKGIKDPVSVHAGMGPVCRSKLLSKRIDRQKQRDFWGRPTFDYWVEMIGDIPVLLIVDLCDEYGGRSVTNAIEDVLQEINLAAKGLCQNVIYKDTMGNWDRIIVVGNQFVRFAPIVKGRIGRTIKDNEAANLAAVTPYVK